MKKNANKIFAWFMALVMALLSIPLTSTTALGASAFYVGAKQFRWYYQDLLGDDLNIVSNGRLSSNKKNELLFGFDMSNKGFNQHRIEFDYNTHDNLEQRITIEKRANDLAVVRYRLFNYNDPNQPTPNSYVQLQNMDIPTKNASGWSVFRNGGFVTPNFNQVVPYNTSDIRTSKVNTIVLPDPTTPDLLDFGRFGSKSTANSRYESPAPTVTNNDETWAHEIAFIVTKGNGFAFQVDANGETVRMLWNNDDEFLYSTNKATLDGRIYDFDYNYYQSIFPLGPSETPAESQTLTISTGYNDVRSVPTADGSETAITVDATQNKTTAFKPGVNVYFEMPKRFSKTDKKFIYISSNNTGDVHWNKNKDAVVASISLNGKIAAVNDMANASFKNTDAPFDLGVLTGNYRFNETATYTECVFKITGLEASTIFTNSRLTLGQAYAAGSYNGLFSDTGVLPYGRIYTFLDYSIEKIDVGQFVLRINKLYTENPATGNNTAKGQYVVQSNVSSGSFTTTVGSVYIDNSMSTQKDIPIVINESPYFYQVTFVPTVWTEKIESQILKYKPFEDLTYVAIPKFLQILGEARVVRVKDDSFTSNPDKYQDYIDVTYKWEIGSHKIIQNLQDITKVDPLTDYIDYNFQTATKPYQNESDTINFMNLRLDVAKCASPPVGAAIVNDAFELGHINVNGNLIDSEIRILSSQYIIEQRVEGAYGHAIVRVLIPTVDKQSGSTHVNRNKIFMPYGGIYYAFNYAKYDRNGVSTRTQSSNEVNMTLNTLTNIPVPVPQNLIAKEATETSFKITWKVLRDQMFDYLDYNLVPNKMAMYFEPDPSVQTIPTKKRSLSFDVILTKNLDTMKSILARPNDTALYTEVPDYRNTAKEFDLETQVGTSTSSPTAWDIINGGGAVKINYYAPDDRFTTEQAMRTSAPTFDYDLTFKGLDENSSYYIVVVTKIEPYELEWQKDGANDPMPGVPEYEYTVSGDFSTQYPKPGATAEDIQKSLPTEVVAQNTKPAPVEPNPQDADPPAPSGLDKEGITGTQVTIFWDVMKKAVNPNLALDRVEYEIIRVENGSFDNAFVSNKNILTEVLAGIKTNYPNLKVRAYRTADSIVADKTPRLIQITDNPPIEDKYVVVPEHLPEQHRLTDNNLTPNKMYFYYVRTVTYKDDATRPFDALTPHRYSAWVPISVTTSPIKGPQNLKVERGMTTTEQQKMTSFGVSFDAPATMDQIRSGEYILQYSLKEGDKEYSEPINMNISKLGDGVSIPTDKELEGYRHFTYLLEGLNPGTQYMLKVRIVSKATGDYSMWSNEVSYITNADPNQPPDLSDEWTEELKNKLSELYKKPYWRLQDDTNSFRAVYRSAYFDGELATASGNYELATGAENPRNIIIFMPASNIEKANKASKGFTFTVNGVNMVIPFDAMDKSNTQSMKDIIKRYNDRDIKDYFVRIAFTLTKEKGTIEGATPLSDRIDFSLDTVGFTMEETQWDNKILQMHLNYIEKGSGTTAAISEILQELKDKSTSEEMVILIDELVKEIEDELIDDVSDSFIDYQKYSYLTDYTEKQMLISTAIANKDQIVSAYQLAAGKWLSKTVVDISGRKGFYTINPGTYIFAGKTINIPGGVENLPGGESIKQLIIKYSLDDYFGKDNINLNSNLTNQALIGSVARMAGASKTADPADFLRGKGISVSARDLYGNAQRQEVIYITMSLYELKTGTKVSSIRITNQNVASDFQTAAAQYKTHIKAAYQLGLVTGNVQPKNAITVKDYLTILSRLAPKAKLL